MKRILPYLAVGCLTLALRPSRLSAQALPADVGTTATPDIGFSLPRVGGTFSYALNASEFITNNFYNNAGTEFGTDLSGDFAYLSKSQRHPFSAVYDGGVLLANTGQPTTFFQSLAFSQLYTTQHWNFSIADSVSYVPDSPVGGLSGVPGVGDVGVDPIAIGPTSGVGILTDYGPRVSNTASGTISRQITRRVSAQVTGVYSLQRFIGDNANSAIDSSTEGGSGGVSYHFSARDTLSANYNYSNFSYTGYQDTFSAQGVTVEYSRVWSPHLSTDVYVGPQIVSGSNAAVNGSSTEIAAGASASYTTRKTNYALTYSRGVNNGSGVITGSFSDNLSLAAHRRLGRVWSVAGDLGYSRSTSLPNFQLYRFSSDGVALSAQGSRAFGRSFATFASYTIEDQSTSVPNLPAVAANAFNGVYQVFSIGVSYSPHGFSLGR